MQLIEFKNQDLPLIELKTVDTFKWKYTKKLFTLSKVNNNSYQVIMIFDGMQIDLYYCNRKNIFNAIREINSYYYTFQEVNYIDMEFI